MLNCEVIEPQTTADAAVIWLHGLGASGHDFVPVVPHLGLPENHGVRFIFPHAPEIPVTINGGMVMRAWYDILSLERGGAQDEAGIRASAERVDALIAEQETAGVAPSRIVIAGFSQGGAIALHAGLRHPQRLAGIMGLSTYLPLDDKLEAEAAATNRGLPILMCHGSRDPMLPMALGQGSCQLLARLGWQPEWREYPMEHQVCMEEIRDISDWLQRILGG